MVPGVGAVVSFGTVRRKRIDAAFRDASLADLALLNIATDPDTDAVAWSSTLALADRFPLTLYDAAYLELRGAGTALQVPLLGR